MHENIEKNVYCDTGANRPIQCMHVPFDGTVPLKSKLPSSREMRLVSLEIRLVSRANVTPRQQICSKSLTKLNYI